MPIYEYQCDAPACGHTFESMQKVSDDPIGTCPVCEGSEVRKLISASSFVLKGSGWYQTDIARKEKAAKASQGGDKTEAKSTPEKTTPSAPAT